MQSKYIREEIIVERTAREENKAVWEKETAILAALNEYYNFLNASIDDATVEAAMAGEFSRDYISGEMLKTGGGPQSCFALCSKVHWSIYYHRECMARRNLGRRPTGACRPGYHALPYPARHCAGQRSQPDPRNLRQSQG